MMDIAPKVRAELQRRGLVPLPRESQLWMTIPLAVLIFGLMVYGIFSPLHEAPDLERTEAPVKLLPLPRPKPRAPVPEPFEDPGALTDVKDDTIKTMRKLNDRAMNYLLIRMRREDTGLAPVREPDLNPATLEQLTAEPAARRGAIVRADGYLESLWTLPLAANHPSGLCLLHMGLATRTNGEAFYFMIEDDPATGEFLEGDHVEVYGFFLQNYYDTDLLTVGPLLVSRCLRRVEPGPFTLDDGVLQSVEDMDELTMQSLSADAYYYLLHKAWATPESDIESSLDASVGLVNMYNTPDLCRGKVVHVTGQIGRAIARKKLAPDNPTGLSYVWEGQIAAYFEGQDLVLTVNFLERPEYLDRCRVDFYGYFLQRWGYPNSEAGSRITISPFLIGKKITHVPESGGKK